MISPTQQLNNIKNKLGTGIALTAKLLAFERPLLYAILDGTEKLSIEEGARLQWLWEAMTLWEQEYNPCSLPLQYNMLHKPLSNGQTTIDMLLQQPSLDKLTPVFSECWYNSVNVI